jgi:DNA-binding NarL/FixJ family response regulator
MSDRGTTSVLIVEDDLALLAFLVTRLDYESDLRVVGYATDATEALSLAASLRPDVVLSDFDLPDVDGVTLIAQLRDLLPDVGLVLYTAVWSPALERAARLNGADECLDKTVAPSVIVAALRSARTSRGHIVLTAPDAAQAQRA